MKEAEFYRPAMTPEVAKIQEQLRLIEHLTAAQRRRSIEGKVKQGCPECGALAPAHTIVCSQGEHAKERVLEQRIALAAKQSGITKEQWRWEVVKIHWPAVAESVDKLWDELGLK